MSYCPQARGHDLLKGDCINHRCAKMLDTSSLRNKRSVWAQSVRGRVQHGSEGMGSSCDSRDVKQPATPQL